MATAFINVLQLERLGEQVGGAVMGDIIAEINRHDTAQGITDATNAMTAAANAAMVLSDASERLNLQFDVTAAGAIHYASELQNRVGGADNLNALLSVYYDAFYTEQEKFDDLANQLEGTFAALGHELPTTREGVRALVEGLGHMGAAGSEQLAGILQTTPALNEYITALEQQRQANSAAAQEMQAAGALGYGQIVGIDGAIDDYDSAVALADEVARARKEQLQEEQRVFQQLGQMLDSLMLSNQSILDPMERLNEAQRQYAQLEIRAQAGDTDAAGQLQGASTAYLDAAAAVYGQSSSQYAMIFNEVTASVRSLEDQYGDSLGTLGSIESIERQLLREQQRAKEALMRSLDEEIRANEELGTLTDLMGALPDNLARALAAIIPNATTTSGRTYTPGGFDQEGDALLTGATGAVADSYREIFGRDPDDSGLAYWQNRYNSGATIDDIRDSLRNSKEFIDGSHAAGLARVPFDSYIAELHKDEAVLNRQDAEEWRQSRLMPAPAELPMPNLPPLPMPNPSNAQANSNAALLRAFEGMRSDNAALVAQVQALEEQLAAIAGNTGALIDPARRTAEATEETERSTRLQKRNPA